MTDPANSPGTGAPLPPSAPAPAVPASLETQPTVITKNVVASSSAVGLTGGRPSDLGRVLEGERLGHFELLQFVGGGGMGAVFRALDTMLNRVVAVKVLSQDQSSDDETLRRFKNEAQSTARLDHENISRVYYVGEDRGLHYIVFEFIEGINLRDLVIDRGPLPLTDALSYVLQVADALVHATRRDVVHRDVKPSNVIITPEGKVKLVDMGLARLHQVAPAENDLTASGVTLGTFDYISPEQARDPRNADVRSDIYSLGCTLYFSLTGRPPFPDGTVLQKLLQHQGDEPPDPRELRPDLPEAVTNILRKMLAKSPEKRYQDPDALTEDLLLLAEEIGMRTSSTNGAVWLMPTETSWSRWERHLPWVVPPAALLAIVVVLHLLWSTPQSTTAPQPILGVPSSNATAVNAKDQSSPASHESNTRASVAEVNAIPLPETDNPLRQRRVTLAGGGLPEAGTSGGITIGALPSYALAAVERTTRDLARLTQGQRSAASPDTSPPAPPRRGILVVAGPDDDPETYSSLRAACAAAKNNDVIELRYNGRLEERPIALSNAKLTIRAARGFSPIVAFQPRDDRGPSPLNMISIAGGQLTLINVTLELDLSRDVAADAWALFETRHAEVVRLENCWLTINNAAAATTSFHQDVAFFDVKAPVGSEGMLISAGTPPPSSSVELKNCVARGEAALVRANDLQPFQLQWENGFFATTERLLVSDGGQVAPREYGTIQIELRHVTAFIAGGLCRLATRDDAPYQLDTDVTCVDSILIGSGSAPLIEHVAVDLGPGFQERLEWNGDRNFYENFSVFWKISHAGLADEVRMFNHREWQDYWGSEHENTASGHVAWRQLPEPSRAPHAQVPADYALAPQSDNPARAAASDGQDAGCRAELLPAPPTTPAKTADAPRGESAPSTFAPRR